MKDRRLLNGLSLLFKSLNGQGPDYTNDMFNLVSEVSERNTRTYPRNIYIPNKHFSAIHHKSFKLPEDIKNSKSSFTFKKKVKTALLNENIPIP